VLESPKGGEIEDEHSRLCGDVVVSSQKNSMIYWTDTLISLRRRS